MEDDDVGFSPGDLSGWGFTDSSGEGIDEWLGYAYGNIKDFNAASLEEIDKLFGELYGRIPDLNAASPEELDKALGEAYKAAGVQVPEAQKAGFFDAVKQALKTPPRIVTGKQLINFF